MKNVSIFHESRFRRSAGFRATLCALALGIPFLVVNRSTYVGAGEPERPLRSLEPQELSTFVRTQRPTPEVIAELRRRGEQVDSVFKFAIIAAGGSEILNVLENILAVGVVPRMPLSLFDGEFRDDVLFEGVVTRASHAGRDLRAMYLDVRRVFRGSITLTPENSPLRVIVGFEIAPGKPSFEEMVSGRLVFVMADMTGSSLGPVGESSVWPSTGREGDVFGKAWPLCARTAGDVLRAMRSEDETERWLGCARAASTCKQLGGAFQRAMDGVLSRERMAMSRSDLLTEFERLASQLIWDRAAFAFVRR